MASVPECRGCGEAMFIGLNLDHEQCDSCGYGKHCGCCDTQGCGIEDEDEPPRKKPGKLKRCTHCGHIGTDVADQLSHNGSGMFYMTLCVNSPQCWERWERDGDFWERQQTTLLASQGQYNVP